MRGYKIPEPIRELQFHPSRKWRFDFAWPESLLFVEVEGGTSGIEVVCNHCGNRPYRVLKSGYRLPIREAIGHATKKGFAEDQEKYNEATLLGWKKLAFTSEQIKSGYAIGIIVRFFNGR